MTNLDSIFKSRDITLPTNVRLVKAMVFPVVMYGCESWTVKKAQHQRIDAFELWCWRRLLRVPCTARRSNQSILKEISPGCSLEGLMLKLKLQYFGHLMQRVDSLEKTLMLGGIGGRRKRGRQGWDGWMASQTRWTWVWVNSGRWSSTCYTGGASPPLCVNQRTNSVLPHSSHPFDRMEIHSNIHIFRKREHSCFGVLFFVFKLYQEIKRNIL